MPRLSLLRPAFTLIELLVVISIIAILAAMFMPLIAQVRQQAQQSVCRGQMKQVMAAIIAYRTDNEGYYPVVGMTWALNNWWTAPSTWNVRWHNLIDEFLGNYRLLNCPVSAKAYPNWNVVDQQTSWVVRGCAPGGYVCNSAINSQDWCRYAKDPAAAWYPDPGPFAEVSAETVMKNILASARLQRCPVVFDGTWQNDGSNQRNNSWGTYFPHRLHANMGFHDGHLEAVRQVDVSSWNPLQVIDH